MQGWIAGTVPEVLLPLIVTVVPVQMSAVQFSGSMCSLATDGVLMSGVSSAVQVRIALRVPEVLLLMVAT